MSSKSRDASSKIAIAFGSFLLCAETVRNWGAWGHWASYAFDYLFALLLILFGTLCLRSSRFGRTLLVISWVLTVALFSYSFISHVRSIDQPTYGPIPQVQLTIWIGALDALAVLGLLLAAWPARHRPAARGERTD